MPKEKKSFANPISEEKSLTEHLSELRYRLIIIIATIIVCTITAYCFSRYILNFLTVPVQELVEYLTALRPTEGFMVTLKVSFLTGVVIASPVVLYQLWSFVVPALKKKEKRFFLTTILISPLLFLLGVGFAFKIVLPLGIRFLLQFTPPFVKDQFSLDFYISFLTPFLLAFGVIFELPLAVMILTKLHLISSQMLRKKRKHAIVGVFILAAFLTPPDVFTQLLLALPLLLLYEISIIISRICYKKS